jgi:hypothetical protein
MSLSTSGRNAAAAGVTALSGYASLHTGDPGTTGANEVTGGSPAYARKAVTWAAASGGNVITSASVTFDVPAGTTIRDMGLWSALTGGTFYGGDALSSPETYGAQGTYALTTATVTIT